MMDKASPQGRVFDFKPRAEMEPVSEGKHKGRMQFRGSF